MHRQEKLHHLRTYRNQYARELGFEAWNQLVNRVDKHELNQHSCEMMLGFPDYLAELKSKTPDHEFYMLTCTGEHGSKVRQPNFDVAVKEAHRIAKKQKHRVSILGVVAVVDPIQVEVQTELHIR